MEIVYATRRLPQCGGRRFVNARFFVRPVAGAKKVYVESGFPRIAEAYRAAGVKVVIIGPKPRSAVSAPPERLLERIRAVTEPF